MIKTYEHADCTTDTTMQACQTCLATGANDTQWQKEQHIYGPNTYNCKYVSMHVFMLLKAIKISARDDYVHLIFSFPLSNSSPKCPF